MMRRILVFVFLAFLSCASEGEVTDDELELLQSCIDTQLLTAQELSENFVGNWKLEAFGCYGCEDISNPISTIIAEANGTGYFEGFYEDRGDKSFSFSWKVETDPRLRIVTDPLILEVTFGSICEDYIAYSALVVDGPLIIYKRD